MRKIFSISLLLLFVLVSAAWTQSRTVTGTVTSAEDGLGIPGASVVLRGTTVGTVTDFDGNYTIDVPSAESVLVFSFIGMQTQEVTVGNQTVINVELQSALLDLDEVVVVGYGTRLRSELTGSVAQVRSEDIANITQPSVESALQGRTSGVYVQGGSGKLGQAVKIRVRGAASVSASSQPLYVIDGFIVQTDNLGEGGNEPTNPMADLNPADIESIQILKDASAAAIYGARAANGVVLITTKRGQEGRTQITFTAQQGFSDPANRVGFLNREQYIELYNEAFQNSLDYAELTNIWGYTTGEDLLAGEFASFSAGADTDWEDQALRRGSLQQYDLAARGGTENTQFYASLSWTDQEAIIVGNDFDRVSGRLNLDNQYNDKLSFGLNLNIVRTRNFRVANDNAFATPLQMIALPPFDPVYDPDTGELNRRTLYESGLVVQEYSDNITEIFRNIGSVFAEYKILDNLNFRSEWSVDLLNQREVLWYGRLTNTGGPDGYAYDRTVNSKNYSTNNYLTYDFVRDMVDLNLVGGMAYQEQSLDFASMSARGFPNDQFRKIASASNITGASSSSTARSFVSYFARATGKVMDRYLFTLSGRYDASSRFGSDNRFGFFPAASVGWILSNESFLADSDILSFLKLRSSWGLTGNAEIGDFSSRGLYMGSNYAGLSGMTPSSIPSPDLKWETTAQTDIGIDFGFFDNRITGEIGYYVKNTTDLLLDVNIPSTTGFTSVTSNVGDMENKGWEFSLNTANLTGRLQWNTNFNISTNENKVTNLDGQIISVGAIWRAMEGEPIGIFWGKKFAGVDPDNGDALFYLNETGEETTTSLSAAANRIIGDPNPEFMGGITNSFRYGNFDLSVMFQFVYGNDIFNRGRQWQADGFSWFDNQVLEVYENRWQNPGDETHIPQPRALLGNGYGVSSMQVFDGSYIRLKDMTFGYNLPSEVIGRVGLSSTRIFVKGLNLWTLTDYPGWDPEANFVGTGPSAQTQNIQQGFDFYTAPQPRSITFGLTLGF